MGEITSEEERNGLMDNGADNYRRFLEGDKKALVRILTEYNDGLVLFLNKLVCDICFLTLS